MADIILAEFNARVWLVGGEAFIDDMLANTLPPETSIEVVPCAAMADVLALWVQHCGPPSRTGDPWLIHPAIASRVRRVNADHAVFFAQWSAMLDRDAQTVIDSAASLACDEPDRAVIVTEYIDDTAPKALADLSSLRALLIEERLIAHGVARARIDRARRPVSDLPAKAQDSQRVDVVVREPA